jgi:hypothetical protein
MQAEAQGDFGNGTMENILSHPNVDHKRKYTRKRQSTNRRSVLYKKGDK